MQELQGNPLLSNIVIEGKVFQIPQRPFVRLLVWHASRSVKSARDHGWIVSEESVLPADLLHRQKQSLHQKTQDGGSDEFDWPVDDPMRQSAISSSSSLST